MRSALLSASRTFLMAALHHGDQSGHRRLVSRTDESIPARGVSLHWVVAGVLLLVASFYLLYQLGGYLAEMERRLTASSGGEARVIAMGREMDHLKSRLNGLLADSVEIRIKSLERAVAEGRVSTEEIQAFTVLQNDLKLLENYSQASGGALPDSRRNDHARYQPVPVSTGLTNQQLLEDVARIRGLFYLCLSGLATGAGVVLVLRLRARSDSPQLENPSVKRQRQIAHQRSRRKA